MNDPPILILERRSRWAPLLRRELRPWTALICELRSVEQTRAQLQQHDAAFLIVELTPSGWETQLQLLLDAAADHDSACTVSVGAEKYARLALEAGAAAHFTGLHQWESLSALARRYLLQHPQRAASESRGVVRTNWRVRLSWPAVAHQSAESPD